MKQLFLSMLAIGAAMSPASAFEADLDGTMFNIDTVYCHVVGPGITQSHLKLTASGRSINVYTSTLSRKAGATPGVVEPRVILGRDKCLTAESLTSMANRHNQNGEYRYLTGINGDFFITSSFASNHEFGNAILGYPNMSCAIDGKIAAPDMIDIVSRENALITTSDSWYIDATDIKYRLLNNDGSIKVDAKAINYPRRDNELMVYNSYMGSTTGTTGGRELLLTMAEGAQWNINKSTKFIVSGDWKQGGNTAIPADGLVISCGPGYSNEFIDGLKDGDIVKLKIVIGLPAHDNLKPDIINIIGGDVRILNKGNITRDAIRWINTPGSRYQRSVVGFSEDRDMMVFAAVDGSGLTYYEAAGLLKALGCYDGLDLDGGGSTAIWSNAHGIYNSPRDGSERAIGNGLYFAIKAPKDNTVTSIRFADHAITLPRFGSYTPVIYGYNQYGELVNTDVKGFTLSASEDLGEANGSTLLASGSGCHALTATVGEMTATIAVTVDDSFPATPVNTSLLIDNYHATPILLTAEVAGSEMPVAAQAFEWSSADETVATVDADGIITGHTDGTTTITGSRGDITFTIDITVQCPTAASVALNPDLDSANWKTSATGVTVKSFAVAESPAFAIDYTIKNSPSHRITLRRSITLWSVPEAIEVNYTAGSELVSLQMALAANGSKPITIKKDATTPNGTATFDMSEFFDTTDPGIYPITFQTVAFDVNASSTTETYHIDINSINVLYPKFNGVENITTDLAGDTPLAATIVGDMAVIPFNASILSLYDTTGRLVATATDCGAIAIPAPGLYILTATNGTHTLTTKLIAR